MNTEIATKGRGLYFAGGILTFVYLVAVIAYCYFKWEAMGSMEPNSLGDFLAGAFSPLAFAWLVLGFIQQGIELRQNSEALNLQAQELRAAAEHAGAMVELQRKEFELRIQELEESQEKSQKRQEQLAIKKIQPRFSFGVGFRQSGDQRIVKFSLTNHGHECSNVKILMSPVPNQLQLHENYEFPVFQFGLQQPIFLMSLSAAPHTNPLELHYRDVNGVDRQLKYVVSVRDRNLSIDEVNV